MKTAIKNKQGDIIAIPGPKNDWLRHQLRKSYLVRFLRKVQLQLQWVYNNKDKKKVVVAGMVEENPDITTFSGNLIKTLAQEVRASGAQFALTIIPSKFRIKQHTYKSDTLQFSDKWRLFSQQNDIPFIDLTKAFTTETAKGSQLFFERDIHFNKNSHKLAASELTRAYPELFNNSPL
ncbi:alginate O-acetyltransferase AlgX-related protein [sulfur-oxidizing endosymbiont of Gigantopelta aegis]|uniref:alginate O-acetyltransferase AlgX-related protein n=1 Tax=sulfur-oxidizing endosymbiont of Gigantopelta aegis TaxID=2794934 RepID=UPI0031B5EE92